MMNKSSMITWIISHMVLTRAQKCYSQPKTMNAANVQSSSWSDCNSLPHQRTLRSKHRLCCCGFGTESCHKTCTTLCVIHIPTSQRNSVCLCVSYWMSLWPGTLTSLSLLQICLACRSALQWQRSTRPSHSFCSSLCYQWIRVSQMDFAVELLRNWRILKVPQ